MKRVLFLLALLLASSSMTPTRSNAIPYIINFWFPYTDPVAGDQTASGWFSFDSNVLPATGGWLIPLTDTWSLSFTFAGQTFTTSNAELSLQSDELGRLHIWSLYSVPNTTAVGPGFVLDALASYPPDQDPMYWIEANWWTEANPPHVGTSSGRWSISLPEPGTIPVLGLGLAFLVMARRRRG